MTTFAMSPLLHRWVRKKANKSLWAVPSYIDYEDLLQEAMINWHRINQRYNDTVKDAPHMASLFMTAYTRHLINLSHKRKPQEVYIEDYLPVVNEIAAEPPLAQLADNAPEPIASIIRLLTDPNECILNPPFYTFPDGTRDTVNRRLHNRLAANNIEAQGDLLRQLRTYIKRIRLYDIPTVIECVSAMVDAYRTRVPKPTLSLPEQHADAARQRLQKRLNLTRYRRKLKPTACTYEDSPYAQYHTKS